MKLLNSLKSKLFGNEDTKRNVVFFTMILGVFFFNFALFLSVHGGDIKNGFKNLTSLFAANSSSSDDNKNIAGGMVDDFYITSEVECNSSGEEFNYGKNTGNITSGACTVWTTSPESTITFNKTKAQENKTVWKAITDFFDGIQIAGASDKSISDKVSYSLSSGTMRVFEVFGWTSEWTPMNYYETFFTTGNGIYNSTITETSSRWNFTNTPTNNILYRLYEYVPNWISDGTPIEFVLASTDLNANADYGGTIKARVDEYVYNRYYQVQPYVTFEKSGQYIFSSLPESEFNGIAANVNGQNFYTKNANNARSIYQLMKQDQDFYEFESGGGPNLLSDYYKNYTFTQNSDGKWVTNHPLLSGVQYNTAEEARTAVIEKEHPGATRSFIKSGYIYIYCAGDDDHHLPHFKQYRGDDNSTHLWWKWDGTTNKGDGFDFNYDDRGELFVALTNQQESYIKEQREYMEKVRENYSSYSISNAFGGSVALNSSNANVGPNGSALNNSATNSYVWEDWHKYNIQYDIYKATFYNNYQISTTQFSASEPVSNTEFLYVKVSNVALFGMNFNKAQYGTTTYSSTVYNPGYTSKISENNVLQSSQFNSIGIIRKYTSYLEWQNTKYNAYSSTYGFNVLSNSNGVTNKGLFNSGNYYYINENAFDLTNNTNYYIFNVSIPWISRGVGKALDWQFNAPSSSIGSQLLIFNRRIQNVSTNTSFGLNPSTASDAVANVFLLQSSKIQEAMNAFAAQKGYSTFVKTYDDSSNKRYYIYKNSANDYVYLTYDEHKLKTLTLTMTFGGWGNVQTESTKYCSTSSDPSSGNFTTTIASCFATASSSNISNSNRVYLTNNGTTTTLYSYYGDTTQFGARYKTGWTNYTVSTTYDDLYVTVRSDKSYTGLSADSYKWFYTSEQEGSFIYFPGMKYNFKKDGVFYTLVGIKSADNSSYYFRYVTSSNGFLNAAYVSSYYQRANNNIASRIYKITLHKYQNPAWDRDPKYLGAVDIYVPAYTIINQINYYSWDGNYLYSFSWASLDDLKNNVHPAFQNSSYKYIESNVFTRGMDESIAWSHNESTNGFMGMGAHNNGITGNKYWVSSISATDYYYKYSTYTSQVKRFVSYNSFVSGYSDYNTGTAYAYTSDYKNNTSKYGSRLSSFGWATTDYDDATIMKKGTVVGGSNDGWVGGGWGNNNDQYMRLKDPASSTVYSYVGNFDTAYTSSTTFSSTVNGGRSYLILNDSQSPSIYSQWTSNSSNKYLRKVTFYDANWSTTNKVCPSSSAVSSVDAAFGTSVATFNTSSYAASNFAVASFDSTSAQSAYHWISGYGIFDGTVTKFYKRQYSSYNENYRTVNVTATFYGNNLVSVDNISGQSSSNDLYSADFKTSVAKDILNAYNNSGSYETWSGSYKQSYISTLSQSNWNNLTNVYGKYKYSNANTWADSYYSSTKQYEIPGMKSFFNYNNMTILGNTSSLDSSSYVQNRNKLATLSKLSGSVYNTFHISSYGGLTNGSTVYEIIPYQGTYVMQYGGSRPQNVDIFQEARNFYAISSSVSPTFANSSVTKSDDISGKDFAYITLLTSTNNQTTNGVFRFGKIIGDYQTKTKNLTANDTVDKTYSFKEVELEDAISRNLIKNSDFSSPGQRNFIAKASGNHWVLQDLTLKTAKMKTDDGVNLSKEILESEKWYQYNGSTINIVNPKPGTYNYGANLTSISDTQKSSLYITGTGSTSPEAGRQYYYRISPNSSDVLSVWGIKTTPVVLGAKVTKYFYGNPNASYSVNYVSGTVIRDGVLNDTFYIYNELNEIPSSDANGYPTFTASNSNLGKSVTYGNSVTFGSTTYSSVYANRNSNNTAFTRDAIKICTQSELINSANSGTVDCLLESSNSIDKTTNVSYSNIQGVTYLYAKYYLPDSVFKAWVLDSSKNISYEASTFKTADADNRITPYLTSASGTGEIHTLSYVNNKEYNYTTKPTYAFVLNDGKSTKQRYYTLITKSGSTVATSSWYKNGELKDIWNASSENYTYWYEGGARQELSSNNIFNLDGWISQLLFDSGKTYVNIGNNSIRQTPDVYITTGSGEVKYRISFTKENAKLETNVNVTSGKTYTLSIKSTATGTVTVTFGNVSKTISASSNKDSERIDITYTASSSTALISIKGSAGAVLNIKWITVTEGSSFSYYMPYLNAGEKLSFNNGGISYSEVRKTGEKYRRYEGHDVNIRMLYVAADGQLVKSPTETYDIYYSANHKESYYLVDRVGDALISGNTLESNLADSQYAQKLLSAILTNPSDNFVAISGTAGLQNKEYEFIIDGVKYALVPVEDEGGKSIVEYAMDEYALGAYLEIIGYGSENYYYFNANERDSNPPDDFTFSFKNPTTGIVSQLNFSDIILYNDSYGTGKTYLNNPNFNYYSIISYRDGKLYIADASLSDNRMYDLHGYSGVLVNNAQQAKVASVLKQTPKYLNVSEDVLEYKKVQGYIDANYKNGDFYNSSNCWKDVTNSNSSFSDSFGNMKTSIGDDVNYSSDWKIIGYGQLANDIYGYEIVDGTPANQATVSAATKDSVVVFSYDGTTLKIKNVINSNTLVQFVFDDNAYYHDETGYHKITVNNIRSANIHDIYQKSEDGYIHIIKNINTSSYKTYIISSSASNLYSENPFEQSITVNGVTTYFSLPNTKYSLRNNGYIYSSDGSFESNKGFWESNEDTLFYSEKDENKYGNSWKHNPSNHEMKANSVFIEASDCYYLVMPNEGIRKYDKNMSDYGTANIENVNFFKVGSAKYNEIMNGSSFKYGLTANKNSLYSHNNPNQFIEGMGPSSLLYNIESGDNSIFKNGYGYLISQDGLSLYYVVYKLNTLGSDGKDWKALYYWGTDDALQQQWIKEIMQDPNCQFFYDENDEITPNSFLVGCISYESVMLEWRSSFFDENGEKIDLYENYLYLKGNDGQNIVDNNGDLMKLEVNVLFKASKNVLYKYNLVASQGNYSIANVMNYYAEENAANNGAGFYTTIWEGDVKKSIAVSITDASGTDAGAGFNEDYFHLGCGQYGVRMFSGVASAIALTPKNTVLIVSNTIFNKIKGPSRRYNQISSEIENIFGDIYIENDGGNRTVRYYESKFQAGLYEYYLLTGLKKADGKTNLTSDSWLGSSPQKVKEEIPEYILVNNGTAEFTYTSRKIPYTADSSSVYFGDAMGAASSNATVTEFSYSVAFLYAFYSDDEPSNSFSYTERITNLFYKIKGMYEAVEPRKNKISFDKFLLNLDSEYSKKGAVKDKAGADVWLLTAEGVMQVLNSSYLSWEVDKDDYEIRLSEKFAFTDISFTSNITSFGDMLSGDTRKVVAGDYSLRKEKTSTGYKFIVYKNARQGTQQQIVDAAIKDSLNAYQDGNPIAVLYLIKKNNMSYVYLEIQDTDYLQADGTMFGMSDMVEREASGSATSDVAVYTSFFETGESLWHSSDPSDYERFGRNNDSSGWKENLQESHSEETGWWFWSDDKVENATEGPVSELVTGTQGYWLVRVSHPLAETLPIVSSRDKKNSNSHYLFDNLLYNGDYALEIQLFGQYYSGGGGYHSGYYFPYIQADASKTAWKNYWYYRSTLVYLAPKLYEKGSADWNAKYTPISASSGWGSDKNLEKRSIHIMRAPKIYPTSMISIYGRNRIDAMTSESGQWSWYYSTNAGLARMVLAKTKDASTDIGKGKGTIYALFAFDTSSTPLSFGGNISTSGSSTISQYSGTLADAQLNFSIDGNFTNDTNGLAANEMNPGTNLNFKITINGVSYQGGSGNKISEYEQSKEFLIKVTQVRDENNQWRDLNREQDEANFNRWGYIFVKENGSYVAYYAGSLDIKHSGEATLTTTTINNYSFKDVRNDGKTGELWFTSDNSLSEIRMNNLVGAARYVIKVRERFSNGSWSKYGVYTLETGDDKVNNPWGETLQKVENGKYKNQPWAQTLIDAHVRNAFFKYSKTYSDKLFLMTGGIIKYNGEYYYLDGISGTYHNLDNNSTLTSNVYNRDTNFDISDIIDGKITATMTYYGNSESVCLVKGAKTAKYLENSYEKSLGIPDKFRYRFYNDGQKPMKILLNIEEGSWSAGSDTKLVFEKSFRKSESDFKWEIPYKAARSGFEIDLFCDEAKQLGLTDKYQKYIDKFGKVITVDDVNINNGGTFDVLNDILLNRDYWNVYLTGNDAKEHMDKQIKISAKFDVSASYECLYLDLSCALDNSNYINNMIEDFEFEYRTDPATHEYVWSGFKAKEGDAEYNVGDLGKLLGTGYDFNLGNAAMTYANGDASNFADILGNKELNGVWANENSIAVVLTKNKATNAEELNIPKVYAKRNRIIVPYHSGIDDSILLYLCEVDESGKVIGILNS